MFGRRLEIVRYGLESSIKFNFVARRPSDQSGEEEPGKSEPTMIEVSCLGLIALYSAAYQAWRYYIFSAS